MMGAHSFVSLEGRRTFNVMFLLMSFIVIINIVTSTSPVGLFLAIPQYLLVVYLICCGKLRRAVLYHMMFVTLGLSAQSVSGMFDMNDIVLYNYASLKLIGPVRCFYAMNIILSLKLLQKKPNKTILLYKLYRTFLFVCGSGILIGVVGCVTDPYYSLEALISNLVYVFVLISTLFILLRIADVDTCRTAYYIGICAVMAGVCGSFVCYSFLGVVSHYSVYDVALTADVVSVAPILIIGCLEIKQHALCILSIVIYVMLCIIVVGGKAVFGIMFALGYLAYLAFIDSTAKQYYGKKIIFIRGLIIVAVLMGVSFVGNNVATDSMSYYKFQSALGMASGNLDEMGRSPYIRVASLANILYEGLHKPFFLFLGHGYGGYFEDELNLFNGIDLSNGAWGDGDIYIGKFHSGHDTMVTVPFFNGLVGLFLIIRVCWQYIKRIKWNFLNSVAFLWIILMFYYNISYAAIGTFLLFASEFRMHDKNKVRNLKC